MKAEVPCSDNGSFWGKKKKKKDISKGIQALLGKAGMFIWLV